MLIWWILVFSFLSERKAWHSTTFSLLFLAVITWLEAIRVRRGKEIFSISKEVREQVNLTYRQWWNASKRSKRFAFLPSHWIYLRKSKKQLWDHKLSASRIWLSLRFAEKWCAYNEKITDCIKHDSYWIPDKAVKSDSSSSSKSHPIYWHSSTTSLRLHAQYTIHLLASQC